MSSTERPAQLHLRVRSIRQLTPRVKLFEFGSDTGDLLPPFEAGAHVELLLAGDMARCYSLLNDPAERHRYVIAVLREENGRGGSAWMHDVLAEGDRVSCPPPRNTFPLNEEASEHILIAGGIGITPILSMVHRLRALKARFVLHYCTKDVASTAFREELTRTIPDKVAFHHDGGDPSRGLDLSRLLADRPRDSDVYICGPRGMIDAARQAAKHWPAESVHFELFSSGATTRTPAESLGEESFTVELARSKLTLTIPPHKSILAVLADHGIVLPSVCKEGWCGTCKTRVLSGKVDHRDDILEDEVKASNTFMQICVSRALPGHTLVLDL